MMPRSLFNTPLEGPRKPHPLKHPQAPPVPSVAIPPSRFRNRFPNREAFLESCSSAGLSEFTELKLLSVEIPEPYGSRYNAEWWQRQLYERLPQLCGIVPITVRVYWPDRYALGLLPPLQFTFS